jgi:TorA maturation chaperone TorD
MNDKALQQAIAKADLCELLQIGFSYPTPELAQGLLDGSFEDDLEAALAEAGGAAPSSNDAGAANSDVNALYEHLRDSYSHLFLAPGSKKPVFPYEAAFMAKLKDPEVTPVYFRSPCTLDVEAQMKAAGVVPKNVNQEPCDSIFEEFEFLAYLYRGLVQALQDAGDTNLWLARIELFLSGHLLTWADKFMEQTIAEDARLGEGGYYARLAGWGLVVLPIMAQDVAPQD